MNEAVPVRIAVIGTGRVGLVAGACLADWGHHVSCADRDPERIARLRAGTSAFFEPGLAELVANGVAGGRLRFSASTADAVRDAEMVIICVGTPPAANGGLDLGDVLDASREVARSLTRPATIVLKSTVLVGTAAIVARTLAETNPIGERCDVVSMPEFLREGSAIEDFRSPARLIVGLEGGRGGELIGRVFHRIQAPIHVTGRHEAELIKQLANCFLGVKVSFANSVADACERVGANVAEILRGVGADPRIGSGYLSPGLGFGGSCLPKDIAGFINFADQVGADPRLFVAALGVNERRPVDVRNDLASCLGDLKGRMVAILGLSFKPLTDTIVEAPALALVRQLLAAGAHVRVYDPAATARVREVFSSDIEYAESAQDCVAGADAFVIATEWPEFAELDLSSLRRQMKGDVVVDGRGVFGREQLERAGFRVARPHPAAAAPKLAN